MQDLQNQIQVEFENPSQTPGVVRNVVRKVEQKTRICIEKIWQVVE